MKNIYLFTIALLAVLNSYSQNGSLEGIVRTASGDPLPYVNIQLENTQIGTYSKEDGSYYFENIAPGKYGILFTTIGYRETSIKLTLRPGQKMTLRPVVLTELTEALNEVVVNGHQNKYGVAAPSTSLRLRTEIVKLPQNIQVISNDLLQDQQVTSMMDGVIRNVSGVSMIEHWGNFARVNMRGFRLPAFRNGVNVQDSWGPLSEDISTVDRIEFVKGPAGFMLSAGEPGGFYNVVTKKPTAHKIAEISLAAGSYDSYRATLDLGGKLTGNGKLLYRLNGMYQTADSHRGNEDAQRYGITPAISYKISDNTLITTELSVQNSESHLGAAYVFAPSADGYGSLDRDFKFTDTNYPATDIGEMSLFTNLKHEFSDHWGIESQFAYLRYDQEGNSFWLMDISDTGDAHRYISKWDALSLGKYFQAYLYGNVNTGGINHKILTGFDYSEREYWADWNELGVIDIDTPFNIHRPTYNNTAVPVFDRSLNVRDRPGVNNTGTTTRGFYLQDEIGFLQDRIRLTLAGRYTVLDILGKAETDTKFTPRAGLSVDILPSLKAYALYDQSFIGQTGVSASGDYFDPVNAIDIEGGIKKTLFNDRLKTSLGVYRITKQNVLVSDPDNINFSIQLGEVQSKGIEFDLQGEITPELNVILNYANTNVEITKDTDPSKIGTKVAGHAKHMTNGWLNYHFPSHSMLKGFGASIGYQYQVDRSSWSWGADNQTDLPDYFRLDGGLSWQNKSLRIQLNVNNLLDEYLYSGSNYGSYLYWQSEPGINGRITATYSF